MNTISREEYGDKIRLIDSSKIVLAVANCVNVENCCGKLFNDFYISVEAVSTVSNIVAQPVTMPMGIVGSAQSNMLHPQVGIDFVH